MLVVEDLLKSLEVRFEGDGVLCAKRKILPAGFVRDFGYTSLAELCLPSLAAETGSIRRYGETAKGALVVPCAAQPTRLLVDDHLGVIHFVPFIPHHLCGCSA